MILPVQNPNHVKLANFTYFYYLTIPWTNVGWLFLLELPHLHNTTQLQSARLFQWTRIFSGIMRRGPKEKKCLAYFHYRKYFFITIDFTQEIVFQSKVILGDLNLYCQNSNEQTSCGWVALHICFYMFVKRLYW